MIMMRSIVLLALTLLFSQTVTVAAAPTGKYFDKYIIVLLENQDLDSILADPNFKAIATKGLLQTNYHGVAHPSQPNYWAIIAGAHLFPGVTYIGGNATALATVNGDTGDNNFDIYDTDTIADLLDAVGLDYKMYSEDYPTPGKCFLGSGYGNESASVVGNYSASLIGTSPIDRLYKRKHNPFISFKTFVDNSTRCEAQRDFNDLLSDLATGDLPAFSFVVPNQADDDHDTTITYSGIWFAKFIQNVTNSPVYNTSRVLVHVTFDEDDTAYTYYDDAPVDNAGHVNPYYNATCYDILYGKNGSDYPYNYCAPPGCTDLLDCTLDTNNNKVYSILLGNACPTTLIGTSDSNYYSHYSVLATLEDNWGLGTLGRGDTDAPIFALSDATVNTNSTPTGKWFDKYFIVLLENQDLASILADPNFKNISTMGLLQTNYHGVAHPSQPNYWAIIAGDHMFPGVTYIGGNATAKAIVNGDNGDDNFDIYNTNTIADLLDAAGLNYKVYSENYPTPGECFLGSGYGNESATVVENYNPSLNGTSPIDRLYKRKHNPFISFKTFVNNATRCGRQRDFNDLINDLANGNLADFNFVVPNQADDGHDTTIAYSGIWFAEFIHNVTTSPVYQTSRVLVHVTYDEDDTAYTYYDDAPVDNAGNTNPYYNATCAAILYGKNGSAYPYNYCAPAGCTDLLNCTLDVNDNKVYSILLGNALPSGLVGTSDNGNYTHYSVLATIEANWGLGNLGRNDVGASTFNLGSASAPASVTQTSGDGSMKLGWQLPLVLMLAISYRLV